MPGIHNGIGTTFRNAAFGGGGTPPNPNFISTWDTTQAGSASDTIVLPMTAGVATVDWGDGTIDTTNTHTYAAGGTYTITISGTINTFRFASAGDRRKITDISNWGTFDIANTSIFYGCSNLDISATDAPTLTSTDLNNMFRNCPSLTTPDFSGWDVSSVTSMWAMFYGAFNFNGNVTSWDVSNVTTFVYDQSGFIIGMFTQCRLFNQDIGGWDVSSSSNLSGMFSGCSIFNQDLSNWNMSNKTRLKGMFDACLQFNNGGSDGIKNWDVSNVQSFGNTNIGIFSSAYVFNQPIGSWDMSSALDISNMFYRAYAFNQDIGAWNLSNCISTYKMFDACSQFNNGGTSSINNWDVSNVTNMGYMFRNSNGFDQNISSWDINQVSNFGNFMQSATGLSTANYDALLIAWDAQGAMSYSGTVNFGGSQYSCRAEAARTSLISKWGGITDGGLNTSINCNFVSTWDTTNAGSASDTIVLPMTAGPTVDWGDGNTDTTNTHTYASGGTYTITIEGTVNTFRFAGAGDRLKILDVSNWGGFDITSDRTFQSCNNLDVTATDVPIVSGYNAGMSTFQACNLTNVDFSTWDFSACDRFRLFIASNTNFTGNVEGVIHSGVIRIDQGFISTPLGSPDLSTWDVSGIVFWQDALRSCQLGALTDVSGWVPQGNMTGAFLINPDFEGLGLDTWTIGAITAAGNTFVATNISTVNYDLLLVSWEAQAPSNAVTISFNAANYTIGSAADTARTSLITTYGWTITDGGGI